MLRMLQTLKLRCTSCPSKCVQSWNVVYSCQSRCVHEMLHAAFEIWLSVGPGQPQKSPDNQKYWCSCPTDNHIGCKGSCYVQLSIKVCQWSMECNKCPRCVHLSIKVHEYMECCKRSWSVLAVNQIVIITYPSGIINVDSTSISTIFIRRRKTSKIGVEISTSIRRWNLICSC